MAMIKVSPEVKPQMQPKSTCCWYTCLEMLFKWKHKDTSTILPKMNEHPDLWAYEMIDWGIAPSECRPTARQLGLRASGDGEIDAYYLSEGLKKYGPYWIAGMWRQNSSHVIVVTGCDPDSGRIKYVDPLENYSLAESNGTISWLNERGNVWKNCDASVMYWG